MGLPGLHLEPWEERARRTDRAGAMSRAPNQMAVERRAAVSVGAVGELEAELGRELRRARGHERHHSQSDEAARFEEVSERPAQPFPRPAVARVAGPRA